MREITQVCHLFGSFSLVIMVYFNGERRASAEMPLLVHFQRIVLPHYPAPEHEGTAMKRLSLSGHL